MTDQPFHSLARSPLALLPAPGGRGRRPEYPASHHISSSDVSFCEARLYGNTQDQEARP